MTIGIPGGVNIDPTKMEMTAMRVSWNAIDVGGTADKVIVDVKYDKKAIKADQFGSTDLDHRVYGLHIKVTTFLNQTRDTATWKTAFPTAIIETSGTSPSIISKITFGLSMGSSAYTAAQTLVLHPVVLADSDLSQDHNFFLAYPEEASAVTYGPEEQSKIKIVWTIYPTLTGSGAPKWYSFGSLAA